MSADYGETGTSADLRVHIDNVTCLCCLRETHSNDTWQDVALHVCVWCRNVGVTGVAVRQWQPEPAQLTARARALLQSSDHEHRELPAQSDTSGDRQRWTVPCHTGLSLVILPLNCPLSQIPQEIVSGGPSLVIQVCHWSFSPLNCPLSQIPQEIVSGGPSLVIQVCHASFAPLVPLNYQFHCISLVTWLDCVTTCWNKLESIVQLVSNKVSKSNYKVQINQQTDNKQTDGHTDITTCY